MYVDEQVDCFTCECNMIACNQNKRILKGGSN